MVRLTMFALIIILVVGLFYTYLGSRIIAGARWTGRKKWIARLVVVLLTLCVVAPVFLEFNGIQGWWLDAVLWITYTVFGGTVLLFFMFLARDAVLLTTSVVHAAIVLTRRLGSVQADPPTRFDPGRRRFLLHSSNLGLVGATVGLTGFGIHEAHRRADIEQVKIPLSHLPPAFDGFQIVQFSDLHIGPTLKRPFVEGVVDQLGDIHADMIAFTGDLVDGSVPWLKEDVAPLKELSAPFGKYFITGNHEYYSGVLPWIDEADRLGFTVLLNEHVMVERNHERIILAGVTDYSAGNFIPSQDSSPARAFEHAPEGLVRILLAHQPKSIFAAAQVGCGLMLSGHTHGGQFVPWNYFVAFNQPYVKGLHKHGNTFVYVNRGTGYWGPPMRIGIPPEITVFTLTAGHG